MKGCSQGKSKKVSRLSAPNEREALKGTLYVIVYYGVYFIQGCGRPRVSSMDSSESKCLEGEFDWRVIGPRGQPVM